MLNLDMIYILVVSLGLLFFVYIVYFASILEGG
jgi:hypothetical protein